MAKEMTYESKDGVTHNKSYWRVVHIQLDVKQKKAIINLEAHTNKKARDEQKAAISEKMYVITGDTFDNYFAANKLSNKDPYAQGYKVATDTLDTNNKSFFDGALDV
jgi:hypothetical protein